MTPPLNDIPRIQKSQQAGSTQESDGKGGGRTDKVNRLRESVANGTYSINTANIAQKIIDSGVLDEG